MVVLLVGLVVVVEVMVEVVVEVLLGFPILRPGSSFCRSHD